MSITDELRDYIASKCGRLHGARCSGYGKLLKIADRIDKRHAVKVERLEKYRAAVSAMLKEYVKLPVDADGVPININDKVDGYGQMHRVCQLRLYTDGGWSLLDEHGEPYYNMTGFTHVQPDTWERIIGDAMHAFLDDDSPAAPTKEELVERCRRLAGEGK